jgi:tetratricopeptide (TPR) repeat protein
LGLAAKESFNAGKFEEAEKFAREMLELLPRYPRDFAYGANLHDAHQVLGRLALREGQTEKAIELLIASASDNPGSPNTATFGPNVSLAKDLLERGERDAVLQYFELCRSFWKSGGRQLDAWSAAVKSGGTPKFGPNLVY